MAPSKIGLALGLTAWLAGVRPAGADPADAPATTEIDSSGASWLSHAVATEAVRVRQAQDPQGSEGDLRWALDLDVVDPRDRYELKSALGLWWTFDGQPGYGIPYGWASIHSRPNSPLWLDVYQLSAELHGHGVLRLVRVGRQQAEHGLPAVFDGAAVLAAPVERLHLYAFGGRTVHFYDIVTGLFEDWIAATGAELRMAPSLRLDVDYRLITDELMDWQYTTSRVTDSSFGATLWWRSSDRLMAQVHLRGLDTRLAFAGGAAHLLTADATAGVDARAELQLVTLDELNELDDPYSLILGPSLPHGRVNLDAWKSLATSHGDLAAHLGLGGRFLLGYAETPFNRQYSRAYLLLSGTDLFTHGPFAGLTVEYDAHGLSTDQGVFAVNGDAGWRWRRLRLEAGTYYQRWEYIYYLTAQELADVHGVYADVRVALRGWLGVRARYSYEVFDRRLQTGLVSVTQAF